jgi:hypothetical protein
MVTRFGYEHHPNDSRSQPSNSYRYHDHHIHWTGNDRPAVVTQNPNQPHHFAISIAVMQGDATGVQLITPA